MVLRRILAEAISHASEGTYRRSATELYDLGAMNRPSGRDEARLRPRPSEEVPVEEERPRRAPAAAADTQRSQSGTVRRADVRAALSSAESLRRLLVMREILGPPRSISGWDDLQ